MSPDDTNAHDRKAVLDRIIAEHKAKPVGWGYIDIIVRREHYRDFVADVLRAGFPIVSVSWWEYVDDLKRPNTYGMGGPGSRFYDGWFAEVGTDLDEVSQTDSIESQVLQVNEIVENKRLQFATLPDISFGDCSSLTPAFWLDVDDNWRSEQEDT